MLPILTIAVREIKHDCIQNLKQLNIDFHQEYFLKK